VTPVPERFDNHGQRSKASLESNVVVREAGPWSPSVLGFLRHLEDVGFAGAPRVVGGGFDDEGRETVTFIPGSSPQPHAWSDDGAAAVGTLLRGLHDASLSFRPPADATWQRCVHRDLTGSMPVIGHCDGGPWNIVGEHGMPVAFVDFEFAGPADALWELAEVAWLNAQLHDDDIAERNGLPDVAGRARQLGLLVDAYGLERPERAVLVERMIEFAVHSARAEVVEARVTPETTSGLNEFGFPVIWAVTWRVRSASWMLRHRALLEQAIA
jgi:hypothetical protein